MSAAAAAAGRKSCQQQDATMSTGGVPRAEDLEDCGSDGPEDPAVQGAGSSDDRAQRSSPFRDLMALAPDRQQRDLATSSMPITCSMTAAESGSVSSEQHEEVIPGDAREEPEAVEDKERAEVLEAKVLEAQPAGLVSPRQTPENAGFTHGSKAPTTTTAGAGPQQAKGFIKTSLPATHEPMQAFTSYLQAEVEPMSPKLPTSGVVWGQSDRDSVYNFLLMVPYSLEVLLQFSMLLCLDAFLGVMTLLPLRCVLVCTRLLFKWLSGHGANRQQQQLPPQQQQQLPPQPQQQQLPKPRLGGGQVFDLVSLLILVSSTVALRAVRPAFIYFWLRDATNEFLKMSVLVAAVEMADTILGDFGLKVLQALSGTCTLWGLGRMTSRQLVCDTVVALVMVLMHALNLMCQALLLSIALNSKRHGLLALLIGSNFYEIKGSVFKRWDQERIRKLACMDFVERFQLISILVFVVVEDMDSNTSFQPNLTILKELGRILGAEMVIDIVKHAVISRMNDVKPGIYRENLKDLCEKVVKSQSHNLHTLVRFPHLASGALFLRSAVTLFWLRLKPAAAWQVALRVMVMLAAWLGLLLVKTVLGYCLKLLAYRYVQYHNRVYGKAFTRPSSKASLVRNADAVALDAQQSKHE